MRTRSPFVASQLDSQFQPINVAIGAAYGTSKSGIGIAGLGTFKPELIMKVSLRISRVYALPDPSPLQSLIPVVMSGIIAVYGLVVSVLITGGCM